MITIRDVNTGAVETIDGSEESIVKWHQEHPPMFYWVVRKVDKHTANIHIGNPKDGLHKEIAYVMTVYQHNIDSFIQLFEYKEWKLRTSDPFFCLYTRNRKERLGMSDDAIDFCLENYPPNNYSADMTFGFAPAHYGNWGYGTHIDIEYHHPHYSDGRKFDTYANYDRRIGDLVPEPSKKELISLCERIKVVITIDMDKVTTPTHIIDKVIRLPLDERLHRLLKEVTLDD